MHADSMESAMKRLQQKPMDIPPAYLSLMNCAIVVKRVKEKTLDQNGRRVVTISEIIGANTSHSAFSWNPKTDYFDDNLKESKLLQKIAESKGADLNEILSDHNIRVSILKWMLEHNIRNYKAVSEVIGKYYKDPQSLLQEINLGG